MENNNENKNINEKDENILVNKNDLQTIITEKVNQAVQQQERNETPADLLKQTKNTISLKPQVNKLGAILRVIGYSNLNNISIEKAFTENGLERANFISEQNIKLISGVSGSGGGYMIPEFYADEVIPALKNNAVMRKAGTRVIDLPNGNAIINGLSSGVSGYWLGENTEKTVGTPVYKQATLSVKRLAVDVPISNKIIRYSNGNNDNMIIEDLQAGLIATEDLAYIEGTGSSFAPKGLLYLANSSNKNAMTATPSAITRKADLLKAMKNIVKNNVAMQKPVWIMPEICRIDLLSQVDSNSNSMDYARTLASSNMLFGVPVFTTNAISSSSYNVYLVDIAQCIIGQGQGLEINFIPNGDYYNGSATVSGRSTDTSVYSAQMDVDFTIKYDTAVSVITGVTWGV